MKEMRSTSKEADGLEDVDLEGLDACKPRKEDDEKVEKGPGVWSSIKGGFKLFDQVLTSTRR